MTKDRQIAARIDKAVIGLEGQGFSGLRLVEAMAGYLPELHDLWYRVSDHELSDLCATYPGFYRFASLMEEFSAQEQQMKASGSHPYQHLDQLEEPFRGEVERLLRHAGELNSRAGSRDQQTKMYANLVEVWKQDVARLLSGAFAGPLNKEVANVLSMTFKAIGKRL